MNLRSIIISLMFLIVFSSLFSCSKDNQGVQNSATANNKSQLDMKAQLNGIDGKKAMEIANDWRSRDIDIVSSVTPDAVVFKFKDGSEVSIPLPKDSMVVSIAPYINTTHECATHYMSSCTGELKDQPVKIRVVSAKGNVITDKEVKTASTGFFDIWLPRNQEFNVTINGLGKKAVGKISTYRNSKTCYTTFRLK